jgi:hypothetical protein
MAGTLCPGPGAPDLSSGEAMTKRQLGALVTGLLAVLGTLAAAVSAKSESAGAAERVRAAEVRLDYVEKIHDLRVQVLERRLENIDLKLDRLIERGR